LFILQHPGKMISVTNLHYQYPSGQLLQFPDIALERGNHCLLLGDSGSGKTTLLHLAGGLLRSQQGSIIIGGTDITRLKDHQLDRFRGRHIGFIFQKNHLISSLTVRDNLLLTFYLARVKTDIKKIEGSLSSLGLTRYSNSKINELSQGQLQRAAIARAVLNNPSVILADEPTSALDDKNCIRVLDLLTQVAKESRATLIIATHDQRLKDQFRHQITLTANVAV
jgi:ABC-type lipoprotein export system ATPase subunit